MHIAEGVLSGPVLITGAALALAGVAVGLKRLDFDKLPLAGVLAATFFVASLIQIPLGPASLHLVLNGIIGLILGWTAFPAILVALVLQAVFFQFGGLTTLGINTLIMAVPAVFCYYAFGGLIRRKPSLLAPAAFGCGFASVFLAALILSLALVFSREDFWTISVVMVVSNLPVMALEGIFTLFCITFLKKVRPEILGIVPGK